MIGSQIAWEEESVAMDYGKFRLVLITVNSMVFTKGMSVSEVVRVPAAKGVDLIVEICKKQIDVLWDEYGVGRYCVYDREVDSGISKRVYCGKGSVPIVSQSVVVDSRPAVWPGMDLGSGTGDIRLHEDASRTD